MLNKKSFSEIGFRRTWLKPKGYLTISLLLSTSLFGGQLEPRNSAEITASGMGMHTIWLDLGPIREDVTEKMFEAGIKWCRLGVPWGYVEHDSVGYFDFTSIDAIVNQLLDHSITPYLILSDPNVLYNPSRFPPVPDSASYFAAWLAYVDTTVKRYQDRVSHWEIWNEPNLDETWLPAADPMQYSALVCSTARAIRTIDPDAIICLGGMALVDIKYIKSCLENGVAEYVDKIGIHPYRSLPEAPQNLMVWKPNAQFESPYDSYEEEIRALKDTIALFSDSLEIWDTEGCFLSDSIYPNPLSPDPFNPQHSSEITQAKYLTRRYVLNLKHSIEITTWTVDWDFHSLTNNMGRSDWVNDYSERTDVDFGEAPFCGVVYTPQNTYTFAREAEDYTHLSPPMETVYDPLASRDSSVWTPDGAGDSGHAYYDFDLAETGWYTLWSRSVGNGDSISLFVARLDTLWFGMGNWYSTTEYRWVPITGKYVNFFELDAGSHELDVQTHWDGSRLDAWKLVRVGESCVPKESYYALQNVASVFDETVQTVADLSVHFENVSVDTGTFEKFTHASFEDTVTGALLVAYWLGVDAEDNYAEGLLNLAVGDTAASSAVIIDFVSGSVEDVDFSITDSFAVFDSLPVADFPYCVALNWRTGVEEESNGQSAVGNWQLSIHPNPSTQVSGVSFQVLGTNSSHLRPPPAPDEGGRAGMTLAIHDLSGRLVRSFPFSSEGGSASGGNQITWHGKNDAGELVSSGVYFVKLKVGDEFSKTKKLLFLR